jgi:hypothetical protein
MIHWVVLATLLLLAHPGQAPAPGAPVAAAPQPPPGPTPEELARQQLEAHLKELQRRLEFDNVDLAAREQLLRAIIDDCIELGRDYAPYTAKLQEVQAELKKRTTDDARKKQDRDFAVILKNRAVQAMRAQPPRWAEASKALQDALVLVKDDPEALAWKATVDQKLRQDRIYMSILGSLLALVTTGAGLVGWKALRARAKPGSGRVRKLEMIEGPQPGEVFLLEKEITTLGAVPVESDWAIPDPSHRVSRRHCDIARSGRHFFLTDHSSNGTFINGRQVPKGEPVLLRKGDRIALTDEILLRFR